MILGGNTQLACQEVVGRVATRDLHASADLVLGVALRKAADLLSREGYSSDYNRARAEDVLQRAGASAERILGNRRAER